MAFYWTIAFSLLFSYLSCSAVSVNYLDNNNTVSDPTKPIRVKVAVLDLNSPLGEMVLLCMKMALSDFYSANSNYRTRLQLHTINTQNVVDANIAVVELSKHEEVHAIIGPQTESDDIFTREFGRKFHIPVISFTAKSSTVSARNHYSIRTTPHDALQARALADIFRGFNWSEVVVLYEDTDYGNQFLSHLHKASQEFKLEFARVISVDVSDSDTHLLRELKSLKTEKTRPFLVHMNAFLGRRLFTLAKTVGLMSEGYAWFTTDALSNFIGSIDHVTRNSMQGVLGIRPYVHLSTELEDFQERWKRTKFRENITSAVMALNIYGLWAYDAVTALAIAVEKTGLANSTSFHAKSAKGANVQVSTFGAQIIQELSKTKFRGLTGNFQLIDGRLEQSTFEIFNVYGSGEKTVGFWTAERGITRELNSSGVTELKNVMWPGDSVTPPGSLTTIEHLRVGILPINGFTEFVNMSFDPDTNRIEATGFVIDVFLATLKLLPFPIGYEFRHYNHTNNSNWNCDDMLHELHKNYDMVVGATTIWAPRAAYVDFSLPYSESGAILVVRNEKPFDMWIFIKPLSWDLWLAILCACISMGIAVRILEHPIKANKQTPGMVYWSPVIVLAFAERNMVSNNWSIFVLLFWSFMVFILMQSYSAILSAILTVDQLKFAFSDKCYVGYPEGSYMKQFLTEHLRMSETKLRSYSSAEEYHHAMSLGSKNGGIDAIFDEIPYMKILLKKYDSEYKMVGQTYRTGGFGFAFPTGSPLVSHFSKAILDVTQGSDMTAIERKNFGPGYSSQDPFSSTTISQGTSSLTLFDFAGLFVITGLVMIMALFFSETPVGQKIIEKIGHFIHTVFRIKSTKVNLIDPGVGGDPLDCVVKEIHESIENNTSVLVHGQCVTHFAAEDLELGEIQDKDPSDDTSSGPKDSGTGIVENQG